jgi:glycosyltransferase involved in cell wall biosynthesis
MTEKQNILFYIPTISQEWGGVRQYAAGLMNLFPLLEEKYNFYIYHDGEDPVIKSILSEHKNLVLVKPSFINLKKDIFPKKLKYYINLFKNKFFGSKVSLVENSILDVVIHDYQIDTIHCPYQFLPSIKFQNKKVKRITTMHDVQELHFPEFFTAAQRADRAVNYMKYINDAEIVIVSYNHIKEDIKKYFNKNENQIFVLLLKMDNLWYKKYETHEVQKIEIFEKYLFYPANFWKHKNHKKLVEAIHLLKISKGIKVNLIFSGDNKNYEGPNINDLIKSLNLEDQIKTVGIVDEFTLYNLYKNTLGVVVPTLYEAGSFPLMESILLKVPVICSNVTSLPETVGNDKFIFDPNSSEDIAEKVEKLWLDESYRNLSNENNKKQQARLIDTKAEQILDKIYSSI